MDAKLLVHKATRLLNFVTATLCLVLASACAFNVNSARELNRGVSYLPWPAGLDDEKHVIAARNNLPILPGMEIQITSAPWRAAAQNDYLRAPSTYQWTVPHLSTFDSAESNRCATDQSMFGRDDMYFLAFMLNMGLHPQSNTSAPAGFQKSLLDHIANLASLCTATPNRFLDTIGRDLLAPMLSPASSDDAHLRLNITTNAGITDQYRAEDIRERLCAITATDYGNTGQSLLGPVQITSPDALSATLEIKDDNDPVFLSGLATQSAGSAPSDWYQLNQDVILQKLIIAVGQQVTVVGESSPRHVSPCMSVADLQRQSGLVIRAIRRDVRYVCRNYPVEPASPATAGNQHCLLDGADSKHAAPLIENLVGKDGKVTILLRSARWVSRQGASDDIQVDICTSDRRSEGLCAQPEDLVFANGDLVYVEHTRKW